MIDRRDILVGLTSAFLYIFVGNRRQSSSSDLQDPAWREQLASVQCVAVHA